MNAKYLVAMFVLFVAMALALTSRSTLTPERGADHVFYGPSLTGGAFVGQEIAIGNFNGDLYDDFVSAVLWDDPSPGGAPLTGAKTSSACNLSPPWGTILAAKGGDTLRVCDFPGQWAEWDSLGWDSLATGACDDCYDDILSPAKRDALCDSCRYRNLLAENEGAVYVFKGGDWSAKPHDTDLNLTGPGGANHLIFGGIPTGRIYNAMASGNMNPGDGDEDELALGAPDAGNGAVYVIRGAPSWPDQIDLGNVDDYDEHVAHYLIGRDEGDRFGLGLAMGLFDNDDIADLVVVAREGDGPPGDPRVNCGEIYVFFGAGMDEVVDLSNDADSILASSGYGAVIYGPAANSYVGVTHLYTCHPIHTGYADKHPGQDNPVGLTVGDWDGDDRDDLVIGAGHVGGGNEDLPGEGAVYVIFGRPPGTDNKLRAGNFIDLANDPDVDDVNAPDVRIVGKSASALGAGVALLDADGEGEAGGGARDDLLIGAPEAFNGRGEVYIVFGDDRETLAGAGFNDRDMGESTDYDKLIRGEGFTNEYCTNNPDSLGFGDQFGSHFSGNFDFDGDGKNEVGITGQEDDCVFFIKSRSDWPDTVSLATVNEKYPQLRVVEFLGNAPASSSTIRLLDLQGNDNHHDLVFGGYDADNRFGYIHAGEMWVWKGDDIWKSGAISAPSTVWSGNVFVHGDIVVEEGATLTINAGTDVWIWPKDPDSSDDVWPSYPLHFDTTRVEFRVFGNLVVDGAPGDTVRIQAWTMDGPTSDEPDLWWGIHVHDGSATFDYCEIRNARHALSANTPLTITNSTIEHAEIYGLDLAGGDSVYVDNLTMRDIGYAGIKIQQGKRVRLSDSDLSELGDYGVRAYSGAKLYVDNTTIRDADIDAIAIEDEGTYALIEDCTIEDNYRGLRADDEAVMVVEGSTIDQSENYGIFSLYDATIGMDGCTIKNASSGVAVFESHATLIGTLLRDNDVGLYSLQGSAPTVEDCDIIYNDIGVLAIQGGLPNLGTDAAYGYNEIHHSTTYNVSNLTTPDTLKAEYDYWKNSTTPCGPPTSKINGLVDYYPALCDAPSPVSNQPPDQQDVPATYALSPNYPNPFNPTTTVPFAVPNPGGKVTLAIYNVRGQLVRTLVNGNKAAGRHSVVWDGTSNQGNTLSSGVYFLLMRAPGFEQSRKLVLLK